MIQVTNLNKFVAVYLYGKITYHLLIIMCLNKKVNFEVTYDLIHKDMLKIMKNGFINDFVQYFTKKKLRNLI